MSVQRQPNGPGAWLPYLGLIMAVVGIVYQSGVLQTTVARDSDRITKVEASQAASADQINSINVRTARIEAKLDYIVPQGKYNAEYQPDGEKRSTNP